MELEREKRTIKDNNYENEIQELEKENEELRTKKVNLLWIVEEQKRQG